MIIFLIHIIITICNFVKSRLAKKNLQLNNFSNDHIGSKEIESLL